MALFGPVRFVPVVLLGFYLFWVVFFLGAYVALSDYGIATIDPVVEAVHLRGALLLALRAHGTLELDRLAQLLGLDAAKLWSQALAIEAATAERKLPALLSVGLDGATNQPRIALNTALDDDDAAWRRHVFTAAIGSPALLEGRIRDPAIARALKALLASAAECPTVERRPAAAETRLDLSRATATTRTRGSPGLVADALPRV